MKFNRFRGAALAASAVLLISGAATALAGSPAPKSSAAAATEPAGGVDKDTLQQGDQTTLDVAGAAGTVEAPESAADTAKQATEAPGIETDGPGGHADPAGNVDNQFDGEQ